MPFPSSLQAKIWQLGLDAHSDWQALGEAVVVMAVPKVAEAYLTPNSKQSVSERGSTCLVQV